MQWCCQGRYARRFDHLDGDIDGALGMIRCMGCAGTQACSRAASAAPTDGKATPAFMV
jgi:hypothetical protein